MRGCILATMPRLRITGLIRSGRRASIKSDSYPAEILLISVSMLISSGKLILSPSDLIKFMESEYITWLDRFDIENPGVLARDAESETNKILQRRALIHEAEFLEAWRASDVSIVDVSDAEDKFVATVQAMQRGIDIIYQGALQDELFRGYSDFLQRVPGGSELGDYHYEPWDTKLGLSTKPYFLIQLACYADMLREIQGVSPLKVHVVLGDKSVRSFRTDDYVYYYRHLRKALLEQQNNFDISVSPEISASADHGRWSTHVESLLDERDHLSLVANIRAVQMKKLIDAGITTMSQLASTEKTSIPKMQEATFNVLKQQARLQVESKGLPQPKFEIITPQMHGFGLTALPAPSELDVYFDMEGFPLIVGGLEYLFGASYLENGQLQFADWWALERKDEKRAFEEFVSWAHSRWTQDRMMHIYHYAAYEKSALRRLMGRYGTMESEVDDLLRNEVLVDLYTIVKQGIRIGEKNYSIKSVEHLYKDKRAGDVATAMDSVVFFEKWLVEQDGTDWQTSKILKDIRDYNKEDCDSTYMLAEWLRDLQKKNQIEPKSITLSDLAEDAERKKARTEAALLATKLLKDVESDPAKKTEDMRVRELLAHILEFHWREAKPVFWAKFDRADMTEEERFHDSGCLAGLERTSAPPEEQQKSFVYEYDFDPAQDTKIDAGKKCFFADDLEQTISVERIDTDNGKIYLKRAKAREAPPDRLSLILDELVSATQLSNSIFKLVQQFERTGQLCATLNTFLKRSAPEILNHQGKLILDGEDLTQGISRAISNLQNSTLCIQGPPGAGKTHTASKAICDLIARGKRIGVMSNSHKAVTHLMEKVVEEAARRSLVCRGKKVQSEKEVFKNSSITAVSSDKFFKSPTDFEIVGGTAWLFCRDEAENLLDYLFVDEAGQVSIANLAAVARCASNLVLIGDQMQLGQPIQGSHPGESGQSLLEYLLQDNQVVPDDFGIFLSKTWRMHPDICSFISGAVYEDRLFPVEDTSRRFLEIPAELMAKSSIKATGIAFIGVEHEGNSQDSEEEASAIASIVKDLLKCTLNDNGKVRTITLDDILLVAPYNMQVRRLRNLIPGCRAGSVDKFQGQEAPIVIISMCPSSGDESSRGLEFIFNKNRLNVAISRAQCLALVVGNPGLALTKCNSIEQLELVNLFCRIVG